MSSQLEVDSIQRPELRRSPALGETGQRPQRLRLGAFLGVLLRLLVGVLLGVRLHQLFRVDRKLPTHATVSTRSFGMFHRRFVLTVFFVMRGLQMVMRRSLILRRGLKVIAVLTAVVGASVS